MMDTQVVALNEQSVVDYLKSTPVYPQVFEGISEFQSYL